MDTVNDMFEAAEVNNARAKRGKDMISYINSGSTTFSPNHAEILADIRDIFKDENLTLTTMTDEQVGLYFYPANPTNAEANKVMQKVLFYWDKLFHVFNEGSLVMPPLVKT